MKQAAPTPPPPPLVVPAETVISVNLDQALAPNQHTRQAFSPPSPRRFRLADASRSPRVLAHQASSRMQVGGSLQGGAVLALTLTSVTIRMKTTHPDHCASETSTGKGKRTADLSRGAVAVR